MRAVTIYTTSRCNLNCKHCGVGLDQDDPRPQQSTDELKKIIANLADGGTKYVTILGGEATLYRNDLGEILDYAFGLNIKISINTNLTVYSVVESLLDKPSLYSLVVSLDGISSATHDKMRGDGTFKKTYDNLKKLTSHKRVLNKELSVELTFVISNLNKDDCKGLIYFAEEVGVRKLNAQVVESVGRAELNENSLLLSSSDLLKAYDLLVINWLLSSKKVVLDILMTPSYITYLNKRYGTTFPIEEYHACGGIDNFSYVDLYGNHIPCPAISYEENPSASLLTERKTSINLVNNKATSTIDSEIFRTFEIDRKSRSNLSNMYPCRKCKFNSICMPCTASVIGKNKDGEVGICRAVHDISNEYVNGLKEEIWGK